MIRERTINTAMIVGVLALPIWALMTDEIFTITLTTRAVILALAAVGLNIALGIGGLVSFGQVRKTKTWYMTQDYVSQHYTTRWEELPLVD